VTERRRSGVAVPLFSLASANSWGVGEFADLPVFAHWLHAAGQSLVQLLPITEIPEAETSPYSSLTAMALDPIAIRLADVPEFAAAGGEAQLSDAERAELEAARRSGKVEHRIIRTLKSRYLRRAYAAFVRDEQVSDSERARDFERFQRDEAWWLDDYALFQAIRRQQELRPWWQWPAPLASRDGAAIAALATEQATEIAYRKYVQWIAAGQWAEARRLSRPLRIFGDLPFMISGDSPDVWTAQHEFRFDATVGVPPDAFSESGQDWGLPPWRWEVMAGNDFAWMRRRAKRSADLFDGFRLDHLVGLYRVYNRPLDPAVTPFFTPADEPTQLALGEHLVGLYLQSGAEIIAEDLGTVPDQVRDSLQRLRVPGFKVFRWEREWTAPGPPFIDPQSYPEVSVATTGTHDTEPLVAWWEELAADERARILEIPGIARHLQTLDRDALLHTTTLTPELRDATLRAVLESTSRLTIFPLQDLFGWRARINTPAQVSDENWTWRLPYPVDAFADQPDARERAAALAQWTAESGRAAAAAPDPGAPAAADAWDAQRQARR
jgi:4-alpha-glucanotransferase